MQCLSAKDMRINPEFCDDLLRSIVHSISDMLMTMELGATEEKSWRISPRSLDQFASGIRHIRECNEGLARCPYDGAPFTRVATLAAHLRIARLFRPNEWDQRTRLSIIRMRHVDNRRNPLIPSRDLRSIAPYSTAIVFLIT